MTLLGRYQNGNYTVSLYDDGTKIRETEADTFDAAFPESIDLKITDRCDRRCPYCHEASTPDGRHGDILHLPFLASLPPHTELAIGGGDPLSHPDLVPFLAELRDRGLIANMTVDQHHLLDDDTFPLLRDLTEQGKLFGLGVSYRPCSSDDRARLIDRLAQFPSAVLHVINGLVTLPELKQLSRHDLKLLILGYKRFRRGSAYQLGRAEQLALHQAELYRALPMMIDYGWFSHISFDELALRQLDVPRLMTRAEWDEFYMGGDGQHTMYIDAVEGVYAVSSVSKDRAPVTSDIKEMFAAVKRQSGGPS